MLVEGTFNLGGGVGGVAAHCDDCARELSSRNDETHVYRSKESYVCEGADHSGGGRSPTYLYFCGRGHSFKAELPARKRLEIMRFCFDERRCERQPYPGKLQFPDSE